MKKAAVYRQFDENGRLLYVGKSVNLLARIAEHFRDAAWRQDVAYITVEWFDTEDEALRAEAMAIYSERPIHNVQQNNKSDHLIHRIAAEFGGVTRFAKAMGVTKQTAATWIHREVFPATLDLKLVRTAKAKGIALSHESLALMRARKGAA